MYYQLIKDTILEAAKRKQTNKSIHPDGECIDEETVQEDFPEICKKITYYDYGIPTDLELQIFLNGWYGNLLTMQVDEVLIVNRSHETFLMIKMDIDKFWIIDSHKEKHGITNVEGCLSYITRFGQITGNSSHVQIGFFML